MEYPSVRQISSTPGPYVFSPENPSVQHVKCVCSTNPSVQYKKPSVQHEKSVIQTHWLWTDNFLCWTDAFYVLNWRFLVLNWRVCRTDPFLCGTEGFWGGKGMALLCWTEKDPFYVIIIKLYKFKQFGYHDDISFNFNKKFSREWQIF